MVSLELDQEALEDIFRDELQRRLDNIQQDLTLWDMKELQRQTNMSINTIKDKFFYDERFPKYRVGAKWYFPAEEAKEFLVGWLKEQPQH